ncbi:hypothetical protein SERLA73DRAFT_174453 [Serpula lacrymans var. lacrymans S7.3]|uniref:Uncharacterized protein n=1 Tax=Serpula lacrymans var. lacrymans (strain S7.3) TaxID=936435 RepID=F8PG04_SERL3|nr:hypothetical protein SERLA73DRAFT_174453 [Serpula lacrymans var. lacrymans S7.3]
MQKVQWARQIQVGISPDADLACVAWTRTRVQRVLVKIKYYVSFCRALVKPVMSSARARASQSLDTVPIRFQFCAILYLTR